MWSVVMLSPSFDERLAGERLGGKRGLREGLDVRAAHDLYAAAVLGRDDEHAVVDLEVLWHVVHGLEPVGLGVGEHAGDGGHGRGLWAD